jgi:RHS repeat-associated protein
MTQAWANSQWQTYTYDASGQRVRRNVNGVETWAIYGLGGELLAEYAASAAPASPQKEYGYRNGQLLITAESRTNVALATNGATASASSTYSPSQGQGYSAVPAEAINGDRTGKVGSSTAWWNDGTQNSGPDWLQVDFNGSKTIEEIDLFTAQDNYTNPSAPTETMTFSLYGLTGYDVQYWNGSTWVTVTGGSITGNNKVWRKLAFSPITTTKIRVLANASPDGWSRVTEVEAWTATSNSSTINWLVSDQLGTPRMIFDKTGALANVKRHDYLPFGEELSAAQGVRSAALGYGAVDGVRQKFTSQERDNETGLDYMHARYFASAQGRFTSADSVAGSTGNPQSLNRYAYVGNNPMNFSDPTGHDRFSASSNGFAEAMGEEGGGYMSPENPDSDTGIPKRYLDEIAGWIAQEEANSEKAANQGGDAEGKAGTGDSDSSGTIAITDASLGTPQQASVDSNPTKIKSDPIQPCSISVSFTGPSIAPTQKGPAFGIGFDVSITVPSGGIYYGEPGDSKSKGSWTVEQWVGGYTEINRQMVRSDKQGQKEELFRASPRVNGNNMTYSDHPGTSVESTRGSSYFTNRDFYIKAYKGKQYCDVSFYLTFRVLMGHQVASGWGSGRSK